MNMFVRIFMVVSVFSLAHAMDEQGDDEGTQRATAIAVAVVPATPEDGQEDQAGQRVFAMRRQLGRENLLAPNKDLGDREEVLAQELAARIRAARGGGEQGGRP